MVKPPWLYYALGCRAAAKPRETKSFTRCENSVVLVSDSQNHKEQSFTRSHGDTELGFCAADEPPWLRASV